METRDIQNEDELHGRIKNLTHRTLLSLLRTYNHSSQLFDGSIQTGGPTKGTYRDTALVLMAIEQARESMRRDHLPVRPAPGLKENWKNFNEALDENLKRFHQGKREPISYDSYQDLIFRPVLRKIAGGAPDRVLRKKASDPDESPVAFVDREAFSCSCIFSLLNMYPCEGTHEHVYMEALDMILRELVHVYPPHYLFGGASLTGTEPHAFVAYVCLRSLKELGETVQQRAREHEKISTLLEQINQWLDQNGPIYQRYRKPQEFVAFVAAETAQLKNPVGLSALLEKLKVEVLPLLQKESSISPEKKAAIIANQLMKALGSSRTKGTVIHWLTHFARLVEKKLANLNDEIDKEYRKLNNRWTEIKSSPDELDPKYIPGMDSVKLAGKQMKSAGGPWKWAVFRSMKFDLELPVKIYEELNANATLAEIAKAIHKVGECWTESAQRTKKYVSTFAKWANQELNRQITLYNQRGKTNFDPVQLAFALRIYNDVETEPNNDLIAKGLEIVMEAQHEDGTWPTGAPFLFDKDTLAAVYVANIEIMNALMPLIDKNDIAFKKDTTVKDETTVERYYACAHRVFEWLEKNQRIVSSPERGETAGWSTDRLFETERVDMWATAAGLCFLIAYGRLRQHLLKLKMAEAFDFSPPSWGWSEIIDAELELPYKYRITSKIYENYIRPFKETGQSDHSAMVLHGPPGTAKSTLAQALAVELGWSLVTITPSDFVKEGIEQSENKARKLFKELLLLRETVVLFDELDEMLRDRQDQESQTGIAMLRFLIPGMLPKLQMLKQFGERNRLIFIVATNYKDRLDSAVVRTGRVDEAFAVVPPDEPSRYCLIWKFLQKAGCHHTENNLLAPYLASKTQGWVFKEIEHLVGLVRKRMQDGLRIPLPGDEKKEQKLTDALRVYPSELSLSNALLANRSYKVLSRQAALDIYNFYSGRHKAFDEILSVLGAYGLNTRRTNKRQKLALVNSVTGKSNERQGLRIVPDQLPKWLD